MDAARLKARGQEWERIAEIVGADVGELVTFSIDHPEVWGPLYQRAEKLRLAEAEGESIKGLCTLLKGDDEEASERAAKELLIHRRHIERQRNRPPRRQGSLEPPRRQEEVGISAVHDACPACEACRDQSSLANLGVLAVKDPPVKLQRRITYAANRVAHGDDYFSIARDTGHPEVEAARWAFIYAKAWDKAYPTARRTAAQHGASLAINRLLDFVASPDLRQAARAGRMLLVHRRHMHWGRTNHTPTYPPSVAQGSVAIPGDGSLKVARRSGPARAFGTVRPSADSASARPRDGPG